MAINESHRNSPGNIESLQATTMITSHHRVFPVVGQSHVPLFGINSSGGGAVTTSLASFPNPISSCAMMGGTPNTCLSMVSSLRGGAAAAASNVVLDMAKESQHLAVLSSYGVVTVLVLNSALRLYTSTKFKRDKSKKNDWVLPNLFALCSGICVLTASFTSVMFQLLAIYSKSALGLGNHAGYAAFKAMTAGYRRLGFHTFLWCLGSFVSMFLISLRNMTNEDERMGSGIFSMMAALTLVGAILMTKVLNLATELIFAPMM